jgi:hypothetical protein
MRRKLDVYLAFFFHAEKQNPLYAGFVLGLPSFILHGINTKNIRDKPPSMAACNANRKIGILSSSGIRMVHSLSNLAWRHAMLKLIFRHPHTAWVP